MKEVKCPICKGKGLLEKNLDKNLVEIRRQMVKTLFKAGFSYRKIMKFTNYKSTYSIIDIVKNK